MLIFPVYHNSHPLEKKYFQIVAYDHLYNLNKGVSNDLGLIVLLIKNMHSLRVIGHLARQTKDESQEVLTAKFYYKQLRLEVLYTLNNFAD